MQEIRSLKPRKGLWVTIIGKLETGGENIRPLTRGQATSKKKAALAWDLRGGQ